MASGSACLGLIARFAISRRQRLRCSPPPNGSAPAAPPITELPDAEKIEGRILDKMLAKESRTPSVVKLPDAASRNGTHLKHYIISYIDNGGKFHVRDVAAKGIVTAITMFYMEVQETAIVSVVCVL